MDQASIGIKNDQRGKMHEKETLDEKLPGLFEPDTLLPIQYFEAMRKKHLLEGEKRLILSVLEDAIECFMKCIDAPTNKGQRLFREADEWIRHEDKHWVFSFDNVCDMLDINAAYMRVGLANWKEKKLVALEARKLALEAEAALAAAAPPAEPVAIAPVPPAPASNSADAAKLVAKPAKLRRGELHQHAERVQARTNPRAAKMRKARA